jgi:predicted O-linked N-acetylglucosamine transferase (SPINDLY family)
MDDPGALRAAAEAFLAGVPALGRDYVDAEAFCERRLENKIRVGFVSPFFYSHSVGRLISWTIANLDRDQFEVVVFNQGGWWDSDDPVCKLIEGSSAEVVQLGAIGRGGGAGLEEAGAAIAGRGMDVLVYGEIGMHVES